MKSHLMLLLMLLSTSHLLAQKDWVLKKDKENIQIYVKKVDGYAMKVYKGVTEMETSVSTLLAVLMDVPGFVEWAPKTKEARLLDQKGENQLVYYLLTDAPWPVNDRDGIYTLTAQKDMETGGVIVKTGSSPDYIPEKKGVVRIRHSEGFWKLIPLGSGKVQVIYQNHSEPGGNIPAWLANSSVVDVPFTALSNIKERVRLSKYQNQQFNFLR